MAWKNIVKNMHPGPISEPKVQCIHDECSCIYHAVKCILTVKKNPVPTIALALPPWWFHSDSHDNFSLQMVSNEYGVKHLSIKGASIVIGEYHLLGYDAV
jgi:hypothetical protein